MEKLNGWMTQNAERRRLHGSRIRRAARRRALEKGHADPIFLPFSKWLAPEFAEAVERYLAERKART